MYLTSTIEKNCNSSNCTEEVIYICDNCGERFQNKTAILSHNKWKHENNVSPFKCINCEKIFTKKFNLNRHQKTCLIKNLKTKNQINCFYCEFSTHNKDSVLKHYESNHSIGIVSKSVNFSTFEEFKNWKQKFEKDTKSQFVQTTGTRQTKGADKINIIKYVCHRDGNFKPRSKGLRHIKLQGSNKINAHCPASITVKESPLNINVNYVDTHVGHKTDIGRLNINESEKASIAQKLALKVPFEQILDEIRDSVIDCELNRLHLTTRKDLWNIATAYNVNNEAILNKNDYVSVEAWVSHMKTSSTLIRFYKPQGILLDNIPELKKEDFFLIIMNDAQLELMKKFGNDCVCIDGTHGLNAYDFQLYTLLVLDNLRQGFPCCFLISNRGDTVAMKMFFNTIKDCMLDMPIKPKTFMSDMDETFYTAWFTVFGSVEHRLFCSWHVDRAWRKNLIKIINKEKQAIIYKKLKILMYETDIPTFNIMINHLLQELRSDEECFDFYNYFEKYALKSKTWAYCHRQQCGINTNMHLENMHRVLKHIYFGGKKVKRLDKSIIMLMKFIRDKLFDRLVVLNRGKISSKLAIIRKIHKKSIGLKNTVIEVNDYWNVSATNYDNIYEIHAVKTDCNCELRCEACDACVHNYSCNCVDFSVKWNMCKHIHLVCMFIKNKNATASINNENICFLSNATNYDNNETEENAILNVVSESRRDGFEKRKNDLIDNALQVLTTIENEEQLQAVSKQLAPLQSIINALKQRVIRIPKSVNEPANKKINTQLRFSSTKKKIKANGKKIVKPTNLEKNILSLEMIGSWKNE